ncbi:MAG: PP2C family protein-serine/threonine phosphatase [Candidatus Omnitrophica bacterium]|nr:PP2C family protein-serine/threonine phosphatase [Candidatus Omnitrophota bacterium]
MSKEETRRIPAVYISEYFEKKIVFITNRVRLFCVLSVFFYFFVLLIGAVLKIAPISSIELITGGVLTAGGAVILIFNSRVKTVLAAKTNAYLYIFLLLALLVKLGIFYVDNPSDSSSIFVFTLFLIVSIIPWTTVDVGLVGLMHFVAYTVEFFYIKSLPYIAGETFTIDEYIEGLVFILMAFVLCIIVRRKETLRDIENFVLFKEVESKNKQVSKELEWAKRVHKTIIAHSSSTERVDIAVSYLPAYYIGGDYVKYEFVGEDHLIFIISDVTGHGVPAALLVNRMHTEFERLAGGKEEPGRLLKKLNEFIKRDFGESEMYLSAFCGMLDFKKKLLLYSSYGHPPQYLYRKKEMMLEKLSSMTSLLGLPVEDEGVFQKETLFKEGDRLLLYTDGVIETVNAKGEDFGNEKLEEFIITEDALPVGEFNELLLNKLNQFKTDSFADDICLLSMDIKPPRKHFFMGAHILKHDIGG